MALNGLTCYKKYSPKEWAVIWTGQLIESWAAYIFREYEMRNGVQMKPVSVIN